MTVGSPCKIVTMRVSVATQKNTREMNVSGLSQYEAEEDNETYR